MILRRHDAHTRIASFGLTGPADRTEPIDVPDKEWAGFYGILEQHRLSGLAAAGLSAGALRLSDERDEAVHSLHQQAVAHVLAIEGVLLRTASTFEQTGVDVIVLKGPALARTVYPEPWRRPYGDLDLLVRTRDWRRACQCLSDTGFRRRLPEPRPRFTERFGYAALYTDGSGLEVDLHRTLAPGPFGLWMDPEELFKRTASFRLGDRSLTRLDDTALFLHACIHASLGSWPPLLMPLRDVAQVAHFADVDWDVLANWARRWRLGAVIQCAVARVSETLGVELPEEAEAFLSLKSKQRERRALAAYTTERRRRGGIALATLKAIPGLRSKAAYVRALLVPNRDFLNARARDVASPTYLRRWAIPLRWLTRNHRLS